MAYDFKLHVMILWYGLSVKLNIAKKIVKVRNNDIESWKNVACLQTYWCLSGTYTDYKDVFENRQAGRMFKIVNPKHEEDLFKLILHFI